MSLLSRFVSEREGLDGSRMLFFDFCGIELEALTFATMESRIDAWLRDKSGRSHHIACLNAYCIALAQQDERLMAIYRRSDISGPDGMPFVHWMRLFMKAKCDRFVAPDIVVHLAARAAVKGYTFYLYGGAPEVLVQMRRNLEGRFPHLQIVGAHAPPFRPLTIAEDQAICEEINRLQPDIILVGLGTPKQDYWIEEHLERLHGSVLIASGATFDFFGGRVKMAPQWIRDAGFEWLFRLFGKDFKRLWLRYSYYHILFLSRFVRQLLRYKKVTHNQPQEKVGR